jgi:hypothetical protein
VGTRGKVGKSWGKAVEKLGKTVEKLGKVGKADGIFEENGNI